MLPKYYHFLQWMTPRIYRSSWTGSSGYFCRHLGAARVTRLDRTAADLRRGAARNLIRGLTVGALSAV
jgi:hypothetical protein